MAKFKMSDALSVLERHWGYSNFRKSQAEAMELICAGKDVVVILPTGGGKSVLFQVPALLNKNPVLVISPLIALMKDQVDDCTRRKIPAGCINSHLSDDEVAEVLRNFSKGKLRILYVSPERLASSAFRSAIENIAISTIAVDESHCVSLLGTRFRPAYSRVKHFVTWLRKAQGIKRPQILAVTATATKTLEADIVKSLGMSKNYGRVVTDPLRENLTLHVIDAQKENDAWAALRETIKRWDISDNRYIVYTSTRKGAEVVAKRVAREIGMRFLSPEQKRGGWEQVRERAVEAGSPLVGVYHAGMSRDDSFEGDEEGGKGELVLGRQSTQDDFKNGTKRVVVATCAFGMGIDVPNIREVLHFGIPGGLEDYVQEIGRAGRDGLPSKGVLINESFSVRLRWQFLERENPLPELYDEVWRWLCRTLKKDEILYRSRMAISNMIVRDGGTKIDPDAIGSMLNVMCSSGLVTLVPGAGETEISVNTNGLKSYVEKNAVGVQTAVLVARHIWDLHVSPVVRRRWADQLQVSVTKADIARVLARTDIAVGLALKTLEVNGAVMLSPSFWGKAVSVVEDRRGVRIEKYLPLDYLEAKRLAAEKRLDTMIEYTRVKFEDRASFIKAYFEK